MQLNPAELAHVLRVWPVGRLATVRDGTAPHVVPIVFVYIDDCIWSPVDGKPKQSVALQRNRNVEQHPSVSLLLDRYDADWRMLWWIRIDGSAQVVQADGAAIPAVPRVIEALGEKYPQYRAIEMFAGTPTLLRIQPERHAAWSAQPLTWESLQ